MTTQAVDVYQKESVRYAESADSAYFSLRSLHKVYLGQDAPAVNQLNLGCAEGELLALLGPSGCGKTTTLRMIAGLMPPTSGDIFVAGRDLTYQPIHRRQMGMVFQSYALFPHLNVFRNVAYGLDIRGVAREERSHRVRRALEMVHLSGYESRRIKELSGGQQQRVALARALVVNPSVLLLDEPLSNLDAQLREAMRREIRDIQQGMGVTTIFVTHDQAEALSMADKVAVMNEGRLEQLGSPEEIYERPASRFVAEFIGQTNLIDGSLTSRADGSCFFQAESIGVIPFKQGTHLDGPATLLIRPHRITINHRGAAVPGNKEISLAGRVTSTTYTGEFVSYAVEVGTKTVTVQQLTHGSSALAPGSEVFISWSVGDASAVPDVGVLE